MSVPGPIPHIGTLREKPLHASLKDWYAHPGDRLEAPVDGFVVDILRGDLVVEVQTRGFSSMRRKVACLLEAGHRVRIVHPIAIDRTIVRIGGDGSVLGRRRSPRHGALVDLFAELVGIVEVLGHPSLEIEVVTTVEEEYRTHVEGRAWRRKGWIVLERRLVDIVDTVRLAGPDDLAALLPGGLPQPFTTAELARDLGRPRRLAQQMAYCLRAVGVIVPVGKQGNAVQYQIRRR